MQNLKIGIRLSLGLGILLALSLLIGGVSLKATGDVEDELVPVNEAFIPLQSYATYVQIGMLQIPVAMNAYLYSGNDTYWQETRKALDDASRYLNTTIDFINRNPYIGKLGKVEKARESFEQLQRAVNLTHDVFQNFNRTQQEMLSAGDAASKDVDELAQIAIKQLTVMAAQGEADTSGFLNQINKIKSMDSDIGQIQENVLKSLVTRDKQFTQQNLGTLFSKLGTQLNELKDTTRNNAGLQKISALEQHLEVYRKLQENMLGLWNQMDDLFNQRNTLRREAFNKAADALASANQLQEDSTANALASSRFATTLTAIITVLSILAGMVLAYLLTRSLTGPVNRALRFARSVADGELHQRLHLRQKDEIGQLSIALDSMVDTLNEKITEAEKQSEQARSKEKEALESMRRAEAAGQEAQSKTAAILRAADKLEEVAAIVSSASAQLSTQIEQSERGASQQAARVSETATAMEEMNATVLEVARNASTASGVSADTRRKAEDGAGVVQKAVDSIKKVQRESLALKDDMNTLSQHAQSISQIMSVISDIADQTNLLALNAAIEAARAGEAGRGFAVVADEVRKLAEKTMASTTDVGNAIRSIQQSATQSMEQVDIAVALIEEATSYANQSGSALQEIVGMVDKSADQVRAIATASEEQSATSEGINQSITEVNDIAGETARAMGEAARAVTDLAEQAQVLSRLIEDMKHE